MKWSDIKDWIAHRLVEKTTWIGIVTFVATIAGTQLAPDKQEAIETAGVAIASMFLVTTKERSTEDKSS